jgi:Adenylate and Guanylate cyclase catalytic domain
MVHCIWVLDSTVTICHMTIHMYPSDVMKSRFTSNNPVIFTLVVICIFMFTSLVFFLYDAKVERRQQSVLRTAVRSTAIVSSLFPSAVRDRIYPVEPPAASKRKGDPRNSPAVSKLHQSLLANGEAADAADHPVTSSFAGPPIAELYSDTTVLFADIAGFTAWSSTRTPIQVFHLLETLYAAFDSIAKLHRIFKVETIGDCYLAVVGLPAPRKNHAVAMARFASACCNKMQELTIDLETLLGPVRLRLLPLLEVECVYGI